MPNEGVRGTYLAELYGRHTTVPLDAYLAPFPAPILAPVLPAFDVFSLHLLHVPSLVLIA